jgi:hypothetical protein
MLKKTEMLPGVKVEVVKPSWGAGVMGFGNEPPKLEVSIWCDLPGGLTGGAYGAKPGAILEIVKKPRRTSGINLARVKFTAEVGKGKKKVPTVMEGEVYWTELRSSCKKV